MTNIVLEHKILLVDDDNTVGESLKAALTEKGKISVVWEQCADDAIRLLSGLHCHSLIINYPLCGSSESSIDMIKMFRQYTKTAPIIVITAAIREVNIDKCMAAGANDIFEKPLNITVLKQIIKRSQENKLRTLDELPGI